MIPTDGPNRAEPDDEVRNALQRLRRQSQHNRIRIYSGVGCWSAVIILLIAAIRTAPEHTLQSLALLLAALCLILTGAIVVLPRGLSDPPSASLASLAENAGVEAIGPLIDALDLALAAQSSAILTLLTLLLPRLTTADASVLSRRQRNRLSDTLLLGDADRDANYLLAILQGLEQIGDEETACTIRRLVQRGAVTVAQRHVLEAAIACLQSLEARLEQNLNRDVLLRGGAPAETAAELLRPTYSEPDTHPETLLRLPNDTEN